MKETFLHNLALNCTHCNFCKKKIKIVQVSPTTFQFYSSHASIIISRLSWITLLGDKKYIFYLKHAMSTKFLKQATDRPQYTFIFMAQTGGFLFSLPFVPNMVLTV